jgi:hypothetical protein
MVEKVVIVIRNAADLQPKDRIRPAVLLNLGDFLPIVHPPDPLLKGGMQLLRELKFVSQSATSGFIIPI